jgi:hypothetical protein
MPEIIKQGTPKYKLWPYGPRDAFECHACLTIFSLEHGEGRVNRYAEGANLFVSCPNCGQHLTFELEYVSSVLPFSIRIRWPWQG